MTAGTLATMPAKMRTLAPFPMPYSLMSSPSHIKNKAPAATIEMLTMYPKGSSGIITPWRIKRVKRPNPCKMARGRVRSREY